MQRAYLEQLVERTPEAISILDAEYRITRINGEFTRMFGYRPEEAANRRIDSLIVPPDRTSETRWISDLLNQGQNVRLETKRQRKDRTQLDVFLSGSPILINETQVGTYVLYRDISEQKRAESLNSALYRIAEKASSAEDLQQFYVSIHAILGELTYARNLYIALYDSSTQLISFPYFVDETDVRPAPKKPGRGLTEYVLRSGEALLCTPEVFQTLIERGRSGTDRSALGRLAGSTAESGGQNIWSLGGAELLRTCPLCRKGPGNSDVCFTATGQRD